MAISRRSQRRAQILLILTAFLVLIYCLSGLSSTHRSRKYASPLGEWSNHEKIPNEIPEEKELVVASLAGDDVVWLDEQFAAWKKNVYVVNNASAPLTVPKNKGREAMPFLT